MFVRMLFIVFLPLVVLAGCATLSEDECQRGDWYTIGLTDGDKGRLTSYLSRHAEACAKHGIGVDQAAWLEGREVGLQSYCRPERAYSLGRRGTKLNPVCPRAEVALLTEANDWGLRYHAISDEIRDVEREIDEITEELEALPEDDRAARRELLRERRQLRWVLDDLKDERIIYSEWI